jgi:hypothetical protein
LAVLENGNAGYLEEFFPSCYFNHTPSLPCNQHWRLPVTPAGRVLVSVGREDDVKFVGLCEARGIPVLRIGVTDNSGELEIQDIATWQLNDIRASHQGTLAELFG